MSPLSPSTLASSAPASRAGHRTARRHVPVVLWRRRQGRRAGRPVAGDIGHWAPDGDLILYYDDPAPYWNGIVRIGELDGDMAAVKRLPEGARVTIEPAG
jgi:hypothetical protein